MVCVSMGVVNLCIPCESLSMQNLDDYIAGLAK